MTEEDETFTYDIRCPTISLMPVHGEHALFINICFLNNTLSVTYVIFPLRIMMYIVRNLLYYHLLFYYKFFTL